MDARITIITLSVTDLERSLSFYRDGLGLDTEGIIGTEFEHGAVAFFTVNDGLILALYPSESLAHEAGIEHAAPVPGSIALGHNVRSPEEVDRVIAEAEAAGATITDRPRERFWGGYGGHFQDPDGHVWEVAYNPDLQIPG